MATGTGLLQATLEHLDQLVPGHRAEPEPTDPPERADHLCGRPIPARRLWPAHAPWALAYGLPLRTVVGRACTIGCVETYTLAWIGLELRIQRVDRSPGGPHGGPLVCLTPTPVPVSRVVEWWRQLLAGQAV